MTLTALASFASLFAAHFLFVGGKAATNRAVAWKKYAWIPVLSLLVACCEVFVVRQIVVNGPWAILPLWLGGSLGCVASVWLTRHWSS